MKELQTFLKKQQRAGMLYLDWDQMKAFLDRIAALEKTTKWDSAADAMYQKNFGVSLLGENYGLKHTFKPPVFYWKIGCAFPKPDGNEVADKDEALEQMAAEM